MNARSETVQKTIKELSGRIAEIPSIYKPLVLHLKQMIRQGVDDEGEILLDVLEKFLHRELSAEALTTFWESFDTRASQAAAEPKYDVLAERLQRGELIPFLGPEIHHLSERPLISARELTQKLAQRAEYPNFKGPLSMISQYYQMTEYGRGTLLRTVRETLEQSPAVPQTNPLYELLVKIPQPVMLISASYDNRLERLFIREQKKFAVISHFCTESDVGKILLKYAEKPQPEDPMTAEAVSKLRLLENGYSIIYKVCGCFGLQRERIVGKTDRDQRLVQQKDELQKQWDLLSEKLSGYEGELIIETDPGVKFKLETQIKEIKAKRKEVEEQLDGFESELFPKGESGSERTVIESHTPDSVIISEDDYFAFAKQVETVIPGYLAKQFSQKSLLFLGHNLDEWQDRLVLNTILEKKRTKSERSYAVHEHPGPYEIAYWKFHGVDLYRVALKTFVLKLQENI